MKRKFLAVLLFAMLAATVQSCGSGTAANTPNPNPDVSTSTFTLKGATK